MMWGYNPDRQLPSDLPPMPGTFNRQRQSFDPLNFGIRYNTFSPANNFKGVNL
jgi:hypothetical protein